MAALAGAEEPDAFDATSTDPAVPALGDLVGYSPGEKYTTHAQVLATLERLAEASRRMRLERYGRTDEGRDLVLAVFSTPERLERLEEVLAAGRRLAAGQEHQAGQPRMPVIVWLSYNVHGDEASGTEVALAVAHRLAAGTDPATDLWLEEAIVVIDPCLNPDGRERHVQWFGSVVGTRPDPAPQALEHFPPWPGGRENHYGFDLNRDWTWLTQAETRARLAAYARFEPHVHVDVHEMGHDSTNFFFPAAKPVHALIPRHVREWGKVFGDANMAAFDHRGWPYYTGEVFDLFYPGYGDTWPSFRGAIGMTYEQAGGPGAGLAIRRPDGKILTLAQRIDHHRVASLATIDAAVKNRMEILADFLAYRKEGLRPRTSGEIHAFLLPPGDDPAAAALLARTLVLQGIEVDLADRPFFARDVHPYGFRAASREPADAVTVQRFEAGTYVVRAAQPLANLARAVLEPRPRIPPGATFYDVSAWSLPYAFGRAAYWTTAPLSESTTLARVADPPRHEGRVELGGRARFAYLVPWPRLGTAKLVNRLLARGHLARASRKAFRIGEHTFGPGSFVFLVNGASDALHDDIAAAARESGVDVVATDSGKADSGVHLGSEEIFGVVRPRIALVAGEDVSHTALGTVRFLLEREHEIDVTLVPPSTLASSGIDDYNVVILVDGSYSASKDRLARWVEDGGIAIGIEGGAAWAGIELAGVELGVAPESPAPEAPESDPSANGEGAESGEKGWVRLEDRRKEADAKRIPGTILRVDLDPDHPLAWGLGKTLPVLKLSDRTFPITDGATAVGVFTEPAALGGYMAEPAARALAGRAWLVHVEKEEGHVVLFSDDPNFRLFWKGPSLLFLAALFLLERPDR